MITTREARGWLLALALASAGAACSSSQPYLWADRLPSARPPNPADDRVAPGDVLAVRVWNHEDMSIERARVRDDGKVSLPFLQDVPAAGMTLAELSSRVSSKLKTWVANPVVTVSLEERRPLRISVLGEATRPGTYDLPPHAGVLEALAAAGGLTQWASRDGIYVLRHGSSAGGNPPNRIRFRYDRLAGGASPDATFRLQPGDVIIVE